MRRFALSLFTAGAVLAAAPAYPAPAPTINHDPAH